MKTFGKIAIGGLIGAGALGLGAVNVSAAIVCSGTDCWHTHQAYDYPRDAHVIVHPDHWRWGPHEHYAWREHTGRGYWNGGQWRDF